MIAVWKRFIIGGGVVGLAVLRAATLQGYNCALVEASADLLSSASGSNSGIACTGVDASPGTLERALIRDSISQLRLYLDEHNIPNRKCGSLVCLWPWDGDGSSNNLSAVLAESHDAGDTHATLLTSDQVKECEPNLADYCQGACLIPGEIVVDPFLYSVSLAIHARENGAAIYTDFQVDPETASFENGTWTIFKKDTSQSIKGKTVVNAAGIFADILQEKVFGQSKWTAKPRRGQYRIYNADPDTTITRPIQPVPSQFTKGIFIFSTIYNQLVVGPTALDQSSRTDRSINDRVANDLDSIIKRVIPNLDVKKALVGEYVGIRPGTDQRDYQIHLFPSKNWIAVAGIRSTGLTASLGIGNYVMRHLSCVLGQPEQRKVIKTTPMPPVSNLIQEFQKNGGYITVNGFKYKVTHPLTKLGWSSKNTFLDQLPSSKL